MVKTLLFTKNTHNSDTRTITHVARTITQDSRTISNLLNFHDTWTITIKKTNKTFYTILHLENLLLLFYIAIRPCLLKSGIYSSHALFYFKLDDGSIHQLNCFVSLVNLAAFIQRVSLAKTRVINYVDADLLVTPLYIHEVNPLL